MYGVERSLNVRHGERKVKTEIRRMKTCKVSEKGADKGIEKGRGEETPPPRPLTHPSLQGGTGGWAVNWACRWRRRQAMHHLDSSTSAILGGYSG